MTFFFIAEFIDRYLITINNGENYLVSLNTILDKTRNFRTAVSLLLFSMTILN